VPHQQPLDPDTKQILVYTATVTIGLLLSGNIYFVKRLVDKLDIIGEEVWTLRQQVTLLNYKVDHS
jgi:hypothetical protein